MKTRFPEGLKAFQIKRSEAFASPTPVYASLADAGAAIVPPSSDPAGTPADTDHCRQALPRGGASSGASTLIGFHFEHAYAARCRRTGEPREG